MIVKCIEDHTFADTGKEYAAGEIHDVADHRGEALVATGAFEHIDGGPRVSALDPAEGPAPDGTGEDAVDDPSGDGEDTEDTEDAEDDERASDTAAEEEAHFTPPPRTGRGRR